jgi:hypothetical protein
MSSSQQPLQGDAVTSSGDDDFKIVADGKIG